MNARGLSGYVQYLSEPGGYALLPSGSYVNVDYAAIGLGDTRVYSHQVVNQPLFGSGDDLTLGSGFLPMTWQSLLPDEQKRSGGDQAPPEPS